MTGISSVFESPVRAELTLLTAQHSVQSCATQMLEYTLLRLAAR